ncbi:MAG: terminase small subunit [Clostridia bacterium]|nr:terminase small subunit [Clostridia bacterium]
MIEKLNMRQRKFAEYYVQNGNAEQAAILAGYSETYARGNAHKLVANSCISAYIKELSDKLKDERILTAKDRQVMLSDIARDTENEPSDRIKAVDTLNKMTGEYTVKVDTTVKTSEKLSDVLNQLGGEALEE